MSEKRRKSNDAPATTWTICPADRTAFEMPEATLTERPGFAELRLRLQSSGPLPPPDVDSLLAGIVLRTWDGDRTLTPPEARQAVVDARNTLAEELAQRKQDIYTRLHEVAGGLLGELAEVLLVETRLGRRDLDFATSQVQRQLGELRSAKEPAGATV